MINVTWFHLLLQRPLTTILLIAITSCSVFVILHTIADRSAQDEETRSSSLIRRNIVDAEFYPRQATGAAIRYDTQMDTDSLKDLESRIHDLKLIKASVTDELRSLQREKIKILREKSNLISKNEKILDQISKSKHQLVQLELDISADRKQRTALSCSLDTVSPLVFNPLQSHDIRNYSLREEFMSGAGDPLLVNRQTAKIYQFDFSVCPLTKQFSFNTTLDTVWLSRLDVTNSDKLDLATLIGTTLQTHQHHAHSEETCMTVILASNDLNRPARSRNNLIIYLLERPFDKLVHADIARQAYVASSSFTRGSFRPGIDIIIPSIIRPTETFSTTINSIPLLSPLKRKYLAAYFGVKDNASSSQDWSLVDRTLRAIHRSSIDDMFLFIYNCGAQTNKPCYDNREKMIEMSIFQIIIPNDSYDIDTNTNDLLYMALAKGSVPVILGSEHVKLPFHEVIDWRRCALLLPGARLPELHFILRSYGPADIYSLKHAGRRVFENYLATSKQIIDATISVISFDRLKYPPSPIEQTKTDVYIKSQNLIRDVNCTLPSCSEAKSDLTINSLLALETLGPREIPFASPVFTRNFSLTLNDAYDVWNSPMHTPNHLMPSNPEDPVTPSEYKFLTADPSYRPIGDGLGGSGIEFSESLGGDRPNEQFTIVLLTYERVEMMMKTLERLKGLAYLNKVLVVWNGIHQPPPADLIWPDMGVPIELVKVKRNSLNNRFLPYDAIDTDAIFSMDDDSPLRPDEIVLAFRVWRESRDRIVGFPGRFHAWDGYQNSWMYNSNHSCELSMVLTGGAFFHRYYSYVYSLTMPEIIRTIVDKFMNCEDIAMNFLVAHLTRKPPIKVTSRWTFHCATCASSLSEDDTHFMERHECLNIFTSIYGYMPLLNTQHRSDSILFKTRLPRDKQKCFRFV